MAIDRNAITAKIRALLTKTTAAGATEEEALSAMAKAGELMERYRVTMTDVEIRDEPVVQKTAQSAHKSKQAPADKCLWGIGRFTGTKVWFTNSRLSNRGVTFFGLAADVDFALYLYEMIGNVANAALRDFQRSYTYRDSYDKREATRAFLLGMTGRISYRLGKLAEPDHAVKTASGTALVVLKNAIVEQRFAELDIRLRSARSHTTSIRNGGAYNAGQAAGENVRFDRPLGGGGNRAALR